MTKYEIEVIFSKEFERLIDNSPNYINLMMNVPITDKHNMNLVTRQIKLNLVMHLVNQMMITLMTTNLRTRFYA